jgi:hypothetical protein
MCMAGRVGSMGGPPRTLTANTSHLGACVLSLGQRWGLWATVKGQSSSWVLVHMQI